MPRHDLPAAPGRHDAPAVPPTNRGRRRAGLGIALAGMLALSACGDDPGGATPAPSEDASAQASSEDPAAAAASSGGAGSGGTASARAGESPSGDRADGNQDRALVPDEQTRAAAEEAVAEMTVEEKAGQVLVATWDGADQTSVDAQIRQIDELHLGGVIVMGSNIPTATGQGTTAEAGAEGGATGVDVEAMRAQNERVADALGEDRDWSGIISVDQEGGTVTRLADPLTVWPSAAAIGAAGDAALTREASAGLGSELAGLGFTMDHAPVADVTTPGDAVIQDRAYGDDPAEVGDHASAAVQGLTDAGLASSPKHFPGHGSVTTDSHVGLPVQETAVEQLADVDWSPFRATVDAGAPAIMMGHIAVSDWDAAVPATLEPQAYQALREDLGFQGVAVTDALNMGAVTDVVGEGRAVDTGVSTPAAAALQAGADLLLMPEDEAAAHADIVGAVESGAIPQERLDEAAARVVAMQMAYDRAQDAAPVEPSEPGSHQDLAARFEG